MCGRAAGGAAPTGGWADTLAGMPRVVPDPALPEQLASLTLAAADGSTVRLGELWADQPRVLVHLRHFG